MSCQQVKSLCRVVLATLYDYLTGSKTTDLSFISCSSYENHLIDSLSQRTLEEAVQSLFPLSRRRRFVRLAQRLVLCVLLAISFLPNIMSKGSHCAL